MRASSALSLSLSVLSERSPSASSQVGVLRPNLHLRVLGQSLPLFARARDALAQAALAVDQLAFARAPRRSSSRPSAYGSIWLRVSLRPSAMRARKRSYVSRRWCSNSARSSFVNGRVALCQPACLPRPRCSKCTPMRLARSLADHLASDHADRSDQALVLRHDLAAGGRDVVTARRAHVADRHDHRLALCTLRTACHIRSEASAEPPGESMRSTTALTCSSVAKPRIACTNASACAPRKLAGRAAHDRAVEIREHRAGRPSASSL